MLGADMEQVNEGLGVGWFTKVRLAKIPITLIFRTPSCKASSGVSNSKWDLILFTAW
jgi:hypothetical protein